MKVIQLILLLTILNLTSLSGLNYEELFSSIEEERVSIEIERGETIKGVNDLILSFEVVMNDPNSSSSDKLSSIIEIRNLENQVRKIEYQFDLKFTKFRYKKGIEVLKMVYEKILSLDHHFATLRSFQDISTLSNPNSYPEFVKIKENLKGNTKSKDPVTLPLFLDNNPLVSMGYAVVSSFFGTGDKKKRQNDLSEISCLLDFTLAMNAELKTIYYETDFLKLTNNDLREDCLKMFSDYIKVINYNYGLEYCRESDDWDKVFESLYNYIDAIESEISKSNGTIGYDIVHDLNSLEFSVYKLLKFVDQYSNFIHQSEKYYQKFLAILHGYKNKDICLNDLPKQYEELEKEVKTSIEKFETAYKIAELKGTKLRDLLYGNPD